MTGDMIPAREVTITQEAAEIHVVQPGAHDWHLVPDGKKHKDALGIEELKASWSDEGALVVEAKREKRKVRQAIGLSPDGKHLLVSVQLETRLGGNVKVRRVYDRAEAEVTTPAPAAAPADAPTGG